MDYKAEAKEIKAYLELEDTRKQMCKEMRDRCDKAIAECDFDDESSCRELVEYYYNELQYKIFG